MKLKKLFFYAAGVIFFTGTFCGCLSKQENNSYQDANSYLDPVVDSMMQKTIQYEGPYRNPVIVIHGLLGSKLKDKNGKLIWGHFSLKDLIDGKGFSDLALPMRKGVPLEKLDNGTYPAGLLDQSSVKVFGVNMMFENYDILVNSLKASGYVPETEPLQAGKKFPSLFVFSYDWRRDVSHNAAELHKFILKKRAMLQKHYAILYNLPNYDIQFDLVGHSMGGLVGRYYLYYGNKTVPDEGPLPKPDFAGAKYVDKLVVVGTPNAGYADTLLELTGGLRLVPRAPEYPPMLLGTFTSYYEMLPDPELNQVRDAVTKEPIDLFDVNTWIKYKWGLAAPDQQKSEDGWTLKEFLPNVKTAQERREIALDHLKKVLHRAKRFKQAMGTHIKQFPSDVSVWLIAGHTVMTNAVLEVDKNGKITCVEKMIGDGKITYASCSKDLRACGVWAPFMLSPINWKAIFLMQGGHMGIMKSPVFDARLRQLLLDVPTQKYHENAVRNIEMIQSGKMK